MATKGIDTEMRILDVATDVFLEVGYRRATFREICRRASANTAAINYHFRDKEGLYRRVLERVIAESHRQRDQEAVLQLGRPEDKLRAFVRIILGDLLHPHGKSALFRLMSHEMSDPTAGLDLMIEKVVRPFDQQLGAVVRELTGPGVSDQQVFDCVQSVVGQCNHLRVAQALISRLGYYPVCDAAAVEHLADHITRFSLAGIRATLGCAE
jgi:AcrR family transcriptional regulator